MGAIDITSVRNGDITTIRKVLLEQRFRRLDLVVSPDMIHYENGHLVVLPGDHAQIVSAAGVTSAAGVYKMTEVADEGLAALLGIDGGYLKKLRTRETPRPDVFDANANLLLHGELPGSEMPPLFEPYGRNLLLRLLKSDDSSEGVVRAVLSPRFRTDMDNLDVLTAVLQGFNEAGVGVVPDICNLSDRRMDIRVVIPAMAMLAPKLLDGYRSPFRDGEDPRGVRGGLRRAGDLAPEEGGDRPGMRLRPDGRWGDWTVPQALLAAAQEGKGYPPGEEPVVFAGLRITNSDVGAGSRSIYPEIRIRVCKNGLTFGLLADRKVHLGGEKPPGVIQPSAEVVAAELALITAQTKDVVIQYSSREFFESQVREIEALSGVRIAGPEQVIEDVTRANNFTRAEAAGIWETFLVSGGSPREATAGEVANAITAYSQTIDNADRASEMDRAALPVMRHLARLAPKAGPQDALAAS